MLTDAMIEELRAVKAELNAEKAESTLRVEYDGKQIEVRIPATATLEQMRTVFNMCRDVLLPF